MVDAGLECPKCGCRHLPAKASRRVKNRMRRWRQCRNCGHTIRTLEAIEASDLKEEAKWTIRRPD